LFAEFCEAHVLRGIGKHHLRLLTLRPVGWCAFRDSRGR
jgi:hypothetical protein